MNYRESRKDRKKSVYRKVRGIGERFVKLHVHIFSNSPLWLPLPCQHQLLRLPVWYLSNRSCPLPLSKLRVVKLYLVRLIVLCWLAKHGRYAAGVTIAICHVPSCSSLDHFDLVYGIFCVRTPYWWEYSIVGRTKVLYAAVFVSWLLTFRFLLKNPRVLLAFLTVLSIWLLQDMSECSSNKTLVRPTIEYCSSVWSPHTKDAINKIEMVQRRAAR
jgi:hypothetical protein